MGVALRVPRADREIDVMSKFFEFRHDLRHVNTIKVHSSARYGLAGGEMLRCCIPEEQCARGAFDRAGLEKLDNIVSSYRPAAASDSPNHVLTSSSIFASLCGAVFASTAVKMDRDGKRPPAPPASAEAAKAEGDAGPGQQRPKKRGRGRPRKEEGIARSRSMSETRPASWRIAQQETSAGDILSPRMKAVSITDHRETDMRACLWHTAARQLVLPMQIQ